MDKSRTYLAIRSIAVVIALLIPGTAVAADWTIARMSGDVRVFQNNVTWVALTSDRRLMPGDALWTGHNGRVMLISDDGHILLKPRSMVKIPAQRLPADYNVLFQSMGTLDAVIEKRDKKHFSIHTPYLAAVVKGTRFTIEIDEEKSLLRVREGIVQAIDKQTGKTIDVLAGQYLATLHNVAGGIFGNADGAKSPSSLGEPDWHDGGSIGGGASSGRSAGGNSANDDFPDERSPSGNNRHRGKGKKVGHNK